MTHYALLLAAVVLVAQSAAPEVEITAEPHHRLTFENKSVRVFNVDLAPNTETLTHWHRHDYIAITLAPAEISNNVKDKPAVTVKFQEGDTRFAAATFAHFVRTLGDQPLRNVTIEILEDESLRHATSPWDPKKNEDRALITFAGGTQQILFVKDAIRVSEFELQPGVVAPSQHHTGPYLLVAVTDLDLGKGNRRDVSGQVLTPPHLRSGDFKWYSPNDSPTIANPAKKPAKFVTLEFP